MWNHVLSNVGYMFLGLLFFVITFVKENIILQRKLKRMGQTPTTAGCWPRIGYSWRDPLGTFGMTQFVDVGPETTIWTFDPLC